MRLVGRGLQLAVISWKLEVGGYGEGSKLRTANCQLVTSNWQLNLRLELILRCLIFALPLAKA